MFRNLVLLVVAGTVLTAPLSSAATRRRTTTRRRTARREVPVRLDIHLMGGAARTWSYADKVLGGREFIFDFDGKVLVDKKKVKRMIPRKYQNLVGDEIYVGHMLIPNTFAFALNGNRSAGSFYIDWNPIGLNLFKTPKQKTYSSRFSVQVQLNALLGYHFLKADTAMYHSPRPGLGVRADVKLRLAAPVSLKISAFQNGYWPDYRDIDGEKKNVMPHFSAVCAGFILHFPRKIRM